jgi:hypothetical protein
MAETTAAIMPEERKSSVSDDIWAMIKEHGESIKEIDEKRKEAWQWLKEYREANDREVQENKLRIQENDRLLKEYQEKNDRRIQDHEQWLKEYDERNERWLKEYREANDRWLKEQEAESNKMTSKLGFRLGEIVEHLIAPNLIEKFNDMDLHFNTSCSNQIFYDKNRKPLAEVDILLENTTIAMAVEVKSKLLASHVRDHIKRMDILRKCADEHDDQRVWFGAVGGALVAPDVYKAARKAGFYLLEQSGDTMKISVTKDFKPREWTFHSL